MFGQSIACIELAIQSMVKLSQDGIGIRVQTYPAEANIDPLELKGAKLPLINATVIA